MSECIGCKQEKKIVAKSLCSACYYRLKKNGTLEYKPKRVSPLHCKVEGCAKPVVARGYCGHHYRNDFERGDPLDVNTFGYGDRRKHPLYECWRWQVRIKEGRVPEWDDFWEFVNSVGEKPSPEHKARRYDIKKPWSPDNFYWAEKVASSSDKKSYAKAWRKKNPLASKGHDLKRCYGISLGIYMEMYQKQQGKCEICGAVKESYSATTGRSQTLVVDHCHDKKHIRALLCGDCNKGLGQFKDSIEVLEKAVEYLRFHKK